MIIDFCHHQSATKGNTKGCSLGKKKTVSNGLSEMQERIKNNKKYKCIRKVNHHCKTITVFHESKIYTELKPSRITHKMEESQEELNSQRFFDYRGDSKDSNIRL